MKAVNLIPSDTRRGGFSSGLRLGPSHAVLALLAVGVALVTVYVTTGTPLTT